MSREQANTYQKFRTADDRQGNLGWAARMTRQGMKIAPEASLEIPAEFSFSDKEALLWGLMKIPRRYNDLDNSGLLTAEDVRAFLRGLVSADVVDIVSQDECKALLPLEVKRALGVAAKSTPSGGLKARVYRPDIGLKSPAKTPAPEAAPERTLSRAFSVPPNSSPVNVGLTRDEKQRKADIESEYESLASIYHYKFIGVARDADAATIKSAYVKRARELHPDNLSGSDLQKDEALIEKADKLYKRLQEANSILSVPEKRAKYDHALDDGQGPSTGGKIRRPEEANLAYKKADVFFKKKDFQTAERHFRIATELDAEDPKYALALAWCIYLNERQPQERRVADAKARLHTLFDKHSSAEAAYKLGLMSAAIQDEKHAAMWFDRCLRLDPKHAEALQQKRVRDMRSRKSKEESDAQNGLLGRFFKK